MIPVPESSGMRRRLFFLMILIVGMHIGLPSRIVRAQTGVPVVHAVLFHSPMCSFCSEIIDEVLPPKIKKYGSQLDILYVNIEAAAGMSLYKSALGAYRAAGGIPVLFIDDTVLRGNAIPEELPGIVDEYLLQGGADWPDIPGLDAYRESLKSTAAPSPTKTTPALTPTFASVPSARSGNGDGGTVRILLFFSPTCSHCRYVQTQVLPPIRERFGEKLDVAEIDTRTETGYALYESTLAFFGLDRAGVPFLVIGQQYLLGSDEIEEFLPLLIEQALAQGGVDWPAVPGVKEYLAAGTDPAGSDTVTGLLTRIRANLARDPAGNAVSIAVLAGMLIALGAGVVRVRKSSGPSTTRVPAWVIPVICIIGLGVAGYLAYIEVFRVEAFCGPVGDCNTVQQSPYARLFGILPIGVLGVFGYTVILTAWTVSKTARGRWAALADLAVFTLAAFGFLFSIYLTFLEPFVIGASCLWCLSSAILMTALFGLSLHPVEAAVRALAPDAG
jgi:uncharacterized membrane protein